MVVVVVVVVVAVVAVVLVAALVSLLVLELLIGGAGVRCFVTLVEVDAGHDVLFLILIRTETISMSVLEVCMLCGSDVLR